MTCPSCNCDKDAEQQEDFAVYEQVKRAEHMDEIDRKAYEEALVFYDHWEDDSLDAQIKSEN